PAPGAQLPDGGARRAAGLPRRGDVGQLDDGRHLRPRVGDEGRRARGHPAVVRGPGGAARRPGADCPAWSGPRGLRARAPEALTETVRKKMDGTAGVVLREKGMRRSV